MIYTSTYNCYFCFLRLVNYFKTDDSLVYCCDIAGLLKNIKLIESYDVNGTWF